jgi:putative transcriptional regulator
MLPRTLGEVTSGPAPRHPEDLIIPFMGDGARQLRTRLRVARAERSVSQTELARAVGVSRQTISSIETGQYCPSTVLALRLAHVLDMPFTELFRLEGVGQ